MANVSINDIAAYTKISKSTVSRVITNKGYVSPEKRKLVESAIKELNYRPNSLARSLVKNTSKTIGVCVPFLNTPFFAKVIDGIESEAERSGYDIFICHTRENEALEQQALCRLLERRVDGILMIPVDAQGTQIHSIIKQTPTVYLVRRPLALEEVNVVSANDYLGAQRALETLIQKGHRKIGLIRGPSHLSTMQDRWQAAQDVLKKYDVQLDQRYIKQCDLDFATSYVVAQELLNESPMPTAICTLHYWGCAALMREAKNRNISIPQDISLSSFEVFDDWNTISPPEITSNTFPSYEMGQEAVRLLRREIEEQPHQAERIQLDLTFHERKSVAVLTSEQQETLG